MATNTVDVFAFFCNGASISKNIARIKQDIKKANSVWKGCARFIVKGVYISKNNLVLNAKTIPAENVFINRQIEPLIQSARKSTNHKEGIYVFYLAGDFFGGELGKYAIGIAGSEVVKFNSKTDYELYGRILLTDMAAGRYTLAHEFGHVLFKRFDSARNRFTHDDPSGPFIHYKTRIMDFAHNKDPKNLMFPISPDHNPRITSLQCKIVQQSKLVKSRNKKNDDDMNIRFF